MRCPRCQCENPVGQKFCGECGTRLAALCPGCGVTNPPGQKFCGECGSSLTGTEAGWKFGSPEAYTPKHLAERILNAKTALEGERKQVTILFADLKGSMELLADRDPEEARRFLDPVLERMMEAIHHYEGTVNQVMGDGIMALFGAPVAHEDHAARACYAALRMQESVRRYADEIRRTQAVSLHIRVGLNSGDVVVRSIGSDLHMDYTAVGQTTHLAARMEQAAMPSSIFLAPQTVRLAEGFIETRVVGPIRVKGLSEPVEVCELIGARAGGSRFRAAVARGLTRFVGRQIELQHIQRMLTQAASGHGQVVAVAGEPGLGKTRLVWEITHSRDVEGWLVLECDSVAYGRSIPYLPVIALLKAYFAIQDRDGPREIQEKVTGKLLTLDRALESTLPVVLSLLNVSVDDADWASLDPPQRRQRTLEAVKRLLLRESQVRPLLVVVENLHWVDTETQAFLDALVDGLPATRILLLVNYRPEYTHRWGSKTYYGQLRLDPLPAETAEQFLTTLLGDDSTLRQIKRMLIERTGGNPFFLEEGVQALTEIGVLTGERGTYHAAASLAELPLPASVQSLLAARLDRLAPPDKRLLQAASVIGKDVPYEVLRAVAGLSDEEVRAGLSRLQAAEFLYEAAIFPDLVYTFKHALTQDVAYGSLLHDQRRDWHRRVGEAVERLFANRTEELAGVLARHFVESGNLAQGLTYSLIAAERASGIYAHEEALRHYAQARKCAEAQAGNDHLLLIDEAIGDVNLMRGRFEAAVASYEESIKYATAREKRAALKLKIGGTYVLYADPRGLPFLMAAAEELDLETQPNEQAQTLAHIGRYHHYAGQHTTALEWFERARVAAEQRAQPDTLLAIYGHLAGAYLHRAQPDDCMKWARRCIEVGEQGNYPLAVAIGYEFLAEDMFMLGQWEESLAFSARNHEIGERIGAEHRLAWAFADTADAQYGQGKLVDAAASARKALAFAEATGELRIRNRISATLACIERDIGEDASAAARVRALDTGRTLGVLNQALALYGRASFHARGDEWEQAHNDFQACRELLDKTDNRFIWLLAGHDAAEAAARMGRPKEALRMITDSLALAREVGSQYHQGVARRVYGQIMTLTERWDEATAAFDDAVALLEANGSRVELGRVLYHRGLMHQVRGHADAVRADLSRAGTIFESTGARRDRERAMLALAVAPSPVAE